MDMHEQENVDPEPEPDSPDSPSEKNNSRWRPVLWLGLAAFSCLLLLCCGVIAGLLANQWLPASNFAWPFGSAFAAKSAQNQIAFIGNDYQLYLTSPTGDDVRQVDSGAAGHRFPTWSPDGNQLAFIGLDSAGRSSLHVAPLDTLQSRVLFDDAVSSPFYLYWNPTGQSLTFLTQEVNDISMRQIYPAQPDAQLIGEGSPFYWAWSPQGDKMLMHVGQTRRSISQGQLYSLENAPLDGTPSAGLIELAITPGLFQAPVWLPDGTSFFYTAINKNGDESIYQTDAKTLEQRSLAPAGTRGQTYLTVSSDGQYLAYLQGQTVRMRTLGKATLIDLTDDSRHAITDRRVLSMFWSPDGSKLALLIVSEASNEPNAKIGGLAAPMRQDFQFEWWVYDVESDQLSLLTKFAPTADFFQIVPYFDQYHHSLTFWSPDSRYFVTTSEIPGSIEGVVLVLDTTGQKSPRQIAEGRLAVWSWQ